MNQVRGGGVAMSSEIEHTRSCGNVFADLGLDHPEELLAKATIVHRISVVIRERGLLQKQVAELLGIDQPKVSALLRGQLSGFSLERLLRFLNALGQDVKIIVQAKPINRAHAVMTVDYVREQPGLEAMG